MDRSTIAQGMGLFSRMLVMTSMLLIAPFAASDGHTATEINLPSESFTVTGELMNLELTTTGGTMTVAGKAGVYGRVFLTYNMTLNPNSTSQGAFTGKGMGIDADGNRNAGVRSGVWKREGTMFTMHELDDITDGNQALCKATLDIATGEFEMTFYLL